MTNSATGRMTLQLHPDSLMDEYYEEQTLCLDDFAPMPGPWNAGPVQGASARLRAANDDVIEVSCIGEHILRLRAAPGVGDLGPSTTESLGLLNTRRAEVPLKIKRRDEAYEALGGRFRWRFNPQSGDFSVSVDGKSLVRSLDGGPRFASDPGEYGGHRSLLCCRLDAGEKIWGFGGRVRPVNRRGESIDMFSMKVGQKYGDYGGFPMPFFISSAGYGIFFNNPWPHVYFDMGKTWKDRWLVNAPGGEFDILIIAGPAVRDIVCAFTELTGRIPPPQKSDFGFWVSSLSFETADQLLDVARRLRREDYPCDNLVLDGPWRGGPEFIRNYQRFGEYMNNDLAWHPDFGDGPAMLDALHAMGFKVALHLNSRIFKKETVAQALDAGLLRQHDDEVVVKLEDDAGENFFLEHLVPRIEEGVDFWWTDHTDRVSGEIKPGIPSRNVFGPLWNRLLSKAMAAHGKGERLSLSRGGGIGSQISALPWPGDTAAGIDRFAEDIWFCLNAGLSGFPVTSIDLAGFTPPSLNDLTPEERDAMTFGKQNLHRRLFQSIMFVPAPRIHDSGVAPPRLPWNCPEESRVLYREFLRQRYQLTPYFFALGLAASRTGEPIVRPLFYTFQDDPATHEISDVFLIGDNLLMAPVVDADATTRRFYLPRGLWYDYWTGERVTGGREIERPCPIDRLAGLPVMVRGGTILPLQDPTPSLSQTVPDSLRLILYPDADGHAALDLDEAHNLRHAFRLRLRTDQGFDLSLQNKTDSPRCYRITFGDGHPVRVMDVPSSGNISVLPDGGLRIEMGAKRDLCLRITRD